MNNLRTKVIIAALTLSLVTFGLPFQSAYAEEMDEVATVELESTATESSVESEEEISVSEDAIAPLAAGDVFNDGVWEYTVIAETSATEGTAKITGYIGSNTSIILSPSATNSGITYTVSEVDLGVSGSADNRTLITRLQSGPSLYSSIDVSGCTALEDLSVNYAGVSNLNVSNNPSLKLLSCYGNSLSSIDVSSSPLLEDLDICQNNLSALDVTQNPLLTGLCCGVNNFTSLDLSNNSLLYYLATEFGDLAELDVTNCSSLKVLYVTDNKLLSIRGLDALSLSDFIGDSQNVTCTMTDSAMGTYASTQVGLLDPSSTFTGPVGFTYDSSSLLFRALAGTSFPTTGAFTTTQGAYALEGNITFEYVASAVANPSTTAPAAGTTDGLAKTGDWGMAGVAVLLGISLLGLSVLGFSRVARKV